MRVQSQNNIYSSWIQSKYHVKGFNGLILQDPSGKPISSLLLLKTERIILPGTREQLDFLEFISYPLYDTIYIFKMRSSCEYSLVFGRTGTLTLSHGNKTLFEDRSYHVCREGDMSVGIITVCKEGRKPRFWKFIFLNGMILVTDGKKGVYPAYISPNQTSHPL